jgi:hypothetical protein
VTEPGKIEEKQVDQFGILEFGNDDRHTLHERFDPKSQVSLFGSAVQEGLILELRIELLFVSLNHTHLEPKALTFCLKRRALIMTSLLRSTSHRVDMVLEIDEEAKPD